MLFASFYMATVLCCLFENNFYVTQHECFWPPSLLFLKASYSRYKTNSLTVKVNFVYVICASLFFRLTWTSKTAFKRVSVFQPLESKQFLLISFHKKSRWSIALCASTNHTLLCGLRVEMFSPTRGRWVT